MNDSLAEAREQGETERQSQALRANPQTTNREDSRRHAARAFDISGYATGHWTWHDGGFSNHVLWPRCSRQRTSFDVSALSISVSHAPIPLKNSVAERRRVGQPRFSGAEDRRFCGARAVLAYFMRPPPPLPHSQASISRGAASFGRSPRGGIRLSRRTALAAASVRGEGCA